MNIVLLILVSLFGGTIQSITGMGNAVILMATMTHIFPYIPIMLNAKFMSLVFFVPVLFMLKKIKWKILLIPVLASYIGIFAGTRILLLASEEQLKFLLGAVMMVLGLISIINNKTMSFKPKWWVGVIAGVVAGFCTATASMSGPPLVMYYLGLDELAEDQKAYYATIMTTFQILNLQQVATLFISGNMPIMALQLALVSALPTALGIFLGLKFAKSVSTAVVKKIVYIFMLVIGLYLCVTNISLL